MAKINKDKKDKILSKIEMDTNEALEDLSFRILNGDIGYSIKIIERLEKFDKIKAKINSIPEE